MAPPFFASAGRQAVASRMVPVRLMSSTSSKTGRSNSLPRWSDAGSVDQHVDLLEAGAEIGDRPVVADIDGDPAETRGLRGIAAAVEAVDFIAGIEEALRQRLPDAAGGARDDRDPPTSHGG